MGRSSTSSLLDALYTTSTRRTFRVTACRHHWVCDQVAALQCIRSSRQFSSGLTEHQRMLMGEKGIHMGFG